MAFEWKDVGNIVGKIAPVVGTALGGPAGGAVGGLIANLLGTDTDADAVAKAIQSDPSIAVKIKEIELQAQQLHYDAIDKERQAQLDELKAYIGDVQSARERQAEHEKATGKSDINLYILSWVTIIGFYCLMCLLLFKSLPDGSKEIAYILLGALTANTNSVYQYFFGSSKGSADKTAQLVGVVSTKAVAK